MARSRRRRKQRQRVSPQRTKHYRQQGPKPLVPEQVAQIGVLVWGASKVALPAFGDLRVARGKLGLPYALTLLWRPGLKVSHQAVMRGFSRLLDTRDVHQAWEMLAMLVDRNLLASSAGGEKERARTLAEIGDLRLPVYDIRVLWVRRTSATKRLIARWAGEVAQGADATQAFLRALYKERAMLCTLPPGWHTS